MLTCLDSRYIAPLHIRLIKVLTVTNYYYYHIETKSKHINLLGLD